MRAAAELRDRLGRAGLKIEPGSLDRHAGGPADSSSIMAVLQVRSDRRKEREDSPVRIPDYFDMIAPKSPNPASWRRQMKMKTASSLFSTSTGCRKEVLERPMLAVGVSPTLGGRSMREAANVSGRQPTEWSHVMTHTLTEPLTSFRKAFDGELITSEAQATYNTVRALWNTEIDRLSGAS